MKSLYCKHCELSYEDLNWGERANHSRWCDKNPKREQYLKNTARMRAGINEESKKKQALGISKAHAAGKYAHVRLPSFSGKTHTEETKKLISEKARASKHRRLMRNVRPYIKKDGSEILLDSSWEEALAKRLDELDIEWTRPLPIQYMAEDNKIRNYFPDFYLPAYNLFLDPKNPAAINAQKNKLDILKKSMNNLVIIDNLSDCQSYSPE